MGSGLNEKLYENCLDLELGRLGYAVERQGPVNAVYKGVPVGEATRYDVLVNKVLLIEAKAVEKILPVHKAHLLTYMRLMDIPIGLLINFNEVKLTDGLHRLVLRDAATPS